jgi:hypothetical protein
MSNGGGAIPSAAEAPDPNDVIAKLNAAATQATANFLQVMTLPLSALLPRSADAYASYAVSTTSHAVRDL